MHVKPFFCKVVENDNIKNLKNHLSQKDTFHVDLEFFLVDLNISINKPT